jgi:amidase
MAGESWRWDATEIARAIRLGTLSAREAVEDALARCAAVNRAINAVTEVLAEEALAAADAADAARARGEALPPLHGVPVTTKINVDQKGRATTNGCVPLAQAIAAEDSPVVANLRRAGAIVIGRTNTPALSMRWFTENALHGRTLNPWSEGHTPGGSSGGASAAVAAGIGAIAHGNDLGGSVRYPAYACGVAGLKPSAGRVPAYNPTAKGERPLAFQLMSVQGPLARRVGDLCLALAAMARGDARDPWWAPAPLTQPCPARPLRVALCRDPAGTSIHPAVDAALTAAARALEAAGYHVEERKPPDFPGVARDWDSLCAHEAQTQMGEAFRTLGDEGARVTFAEMTRHRAILDAMGYAEVLARRTSRIRAWQVFQQEWPLLLCPVSTEPPLPQGLDVAGPQGFARVFQAQQTLLAAPLLGMPAVSVPTGVFEGLPMGVQITAPRWREDLALDAAEAIEAAFPMATPIDPRPSTVINTG